MRTYTKVLQDWEPVIGLEVHVQLNTNTKLFCACKRIFGDAPNSHTCPVCLGMPGALPVLNADVIDMSISLGLAFDFNINQHSIFARKNYSYPDLPKGYQISQFESPINENGHLDIEVEGQSKRIGITRAHIEEDAGKLIHYEINSNVDLNRCGTPLIEIVSEPDMRSPEEAKAYLQRLKQTIQYIDVSDCNMEKGNLRVDINLSLRKRGTKPFGTRREVKNLNSFKFLDKAIRYEIKTQAEILDNGGTVNQCTMLWNEHESKSYIIRTKEDAPDYRYFPEPDLPPIVISDDKITDINASLPELPSSREIRFISEYHLDSTDAHRLVADRNLADYFEETVRLSNQPKEAKNWILGYLMSKLNSSKVEIKNFWIFPKRLSELIEQTVSGTITKSIAKQVFDLMENNDFSPSKIIKDHNLMVSGSDELSKKIQVIISHFPNELERFKNGEVKLKSFFVGQIMRATQGKADPQKINQLLEKL